MASRAGLGRAAALAGVLMVVTAGGAYAQRDDPGLQLNCAGDYFRLCSGLNPDGPEVEACFNRNRANLSAKCRAAIGTYDRAHGGDDGSDAPPPAPRRR
jgi:hypothetical protein